MNNLLRFALVLNSLLTVNGRILRLPCMIDAVFDVVFIDKRLQGDILAVFNSIDDQGCTLKCAQNHECTSYNYQWINKTCEILQKHVQQDNSTDLLDANGWIFKTTNYSNKLIGPTCNSLKPCDPEDLCLDTCSPPFYECIHCQSHYPELKCFKQADVDACASNPCKHASQCLNKSSDYKCTCLEGYTGKNCDIDIDECKSLPCFHGGTCLNQIGKFVCQCFQGYKGIHCEQDIDECLDGTHQCHTNADCTNTFGSFNCKCRTGYSGDGIISCIDVDECLGSTHNCHTNADCTNIVGSFTCKCKTGYSGDGVTCTDVNECLKGTHNCHTNADCTNTVGSFTCNCKTGYSGDGIITCADVDECLGSTHNCQTNADCTNSVGSFTCKCKTGYSGDGVTCTDVNECLEGTHNCPTNADCTNTVGLFTCKCKTGYSGDGIITCTDINECGEGIHNCHANAHCTNTGGSFTCTCNNGYKGNGHSCNDANECQDNTYNCHSNAQCKNTIGSFTCTCEEGYSGNGVACTDIDECTTGVHGCPLQTRCKNTAGMFLCTENIAFGKVSSQSSDLGKDGLVLKSSLGNDGNRNGFWSACSLTTNSENPWWQANLGRKAQVGKVIVVGRTDAKQTNLNPFQISVGEDGSNGGRNNPKCVSDGILQGGKPKHFSCSHSLVGRYVSLFVNAIKSLQLCELEVYEGNMAYKKPSQQSSVYQKGGIDLVSLFGNDGNRNGEWSVCATTVHSLQPWWQVDLGNRVHVGMVVIRSATNWQQNINPFSISVGDAETNGGRSNPLCVSNQNVLSGEVKEMHCGQALLGRYVSVLSESPVLLHLQVCELEVYQAKKSSCVSWYAVGARKNGIYAISDETGLIHHVYCDFSSEPNFAWTLVTSFSLENNNQFKSNPFYNNDPISEHEPNWKKYRLAKSLMQHIASSATHWRATCSYPGHGIDHRDYVRAKLSKINPLTFSSNGECRTVELINIRGYSATGQLVKFWQRWDLFFCTDSSYDSCFVLAKPGSIPSEDNFGHYGTVNKNFRCTENSASTTQYWIGASTQSLGP
ncbi:uncharacterized protein LOC135681253 [Rhopilema esculentum]|uniref:uncharacterized protein LOC135681253 n=1 Tax=Rhopilema esculentum TaxID=499914 RepID=UPI0031CDD698